MICDACRDDRHISCEPIADPEVEMRFANCDCLHDDAIILRYEHVRILIEEARAALQAGRDDACCAAMRRALQLLAPPVRKPPPIRKLAIVVSKPSYAQLSGEPVPRWMETKR